MDPAPVAAEATWAFPVHVRPSSFLSVGGPGLLRLPSPHVAVNAVSHRRTRGPRRCVRAPVRRASRFRPRLRHWWRRGSDSEESGSLAGKRVASPQSSASPAPPLLPRIGQDEEAPRRRRRCGGEQIARFVSGRSRSMFINTQRHVKRTGRHGTPRDQHLQDLVTQFENFTDEDSKESIVGNLANFAYDPYNYIFMHQLNVLELFLDRITEPNERLAKFGIGRICNSCVDTANVSVITQCGGTPLVIQCSSSPVRNKVSISEAKNNIIT